MASLFVRNAGELVTCSGGPKSGAEMARAGIVEGGAVLVEDGVVAWAGPEGKAPHGSSKADETVDAGGRAVLPGFVDSHTHFVFAGYRDDEFQWRAAGLPYMEIHKRGGGIQKSVQMTRGAGPDELFDLGMARLDSMLSFGVTSVEGKSGYGLDLETEIAQLETMRRLSSHHAVEITSTYLGAHSVPKEYRQLENGGSKYVEWIVAEALPEIKKRGLADFCDIFCETNVFTVAESRRLLTEAKRLGFGLKIHADEITTLGGAELAAELGAASADHLLKASDAGIKAMAESGTVATLLPLTAFCLREPYARAREMIDAGCRVALATDFNPGSCYSESVPLLFSLAVLYLGMTVEEAVTAFTINGAKAIGREKTVGSLEPGKQADIVILDSPSIRFLPYHAGVSSVEAVVKKGKFAYARPHSKFRKYVSRTSTP